MNWETWEARFESFLAQATGEHDVAHDLAHVRRVVANARRLAAAEGVDLMVVVPAAWLHDCVTVPKDSPLRPQASRLAAEAAGVFLREAGYPASAIPAIEHAIAAHSFTANLAPQTLEAWVVQDADRLEAIGAIGVARCLMLGGALGRPLYHPTEPFPLKRTPDERAYSLDHFYQKLLKLADEMKTVAGRAEAHQRTVFMQQFLDQLKRELEF
ncbi:MAG: HD domain-containing protein [Anaerolineales bacterium]|nr:HD domain-containing protein [Anaerolineales bacterium]